MKIEAHRITTEKERDLAREIRFEVFVDEQNVPAELELDEYEEVCAHYLATTADPFRAVGTARWRVTGKGIKLERFAVRKEYRQSGVGQALILEMLNDIEREHPGKKLYLHSQVDVLDFYAKFGFIATGDEFDECGIMHKEMYRK